jgi:hypothetical protein
VRRACRHISVRLYVLAVELHFDARPFAEQDAVAGLHVEGDDLPLFVAGAWTNSDDLASIGLSWAVLGMMIPPAVFSSAFRRRITTRSSGAPILGVLSTWEAAR